MNNQSISSQSTRSSQINGHAPKGALQALPATFLRHFSAGMNSPSEGTPINPGDLRRVLSLELGLVGSYCQADTPGKYTLIRPTLCTSSHEYLASSDFTEFQ